MLPEYVPRWYNMGIILRRGIFMALIKCPECGKEISDKAASCPNCGFPITQGNVTQEPPQKQKEYDTIEVSTSTKIK